MLNRAEDERGIFQEMWKDDYPLEQVRQISKISINPGQTRGNHFHQYTVETFIMEKGSAQFTLTSILKNSTEEITLTAGDENNSSIVVGPGINHTLYSKEGCEILILSTKVYDPNDTDTYRRKDER